MIRMSNKSEVDSMPNNARPFSDQSTVYSDRSWQSEKLSTSHRIPLPDKRKEKPTT